MIGLALNISTQRTYLRMVVHTSVIHIKKIVPLKPCSFGLNRIVTVPGKLNYTGSFRDV